MIYRGFSLLTMSVLLLAGSATARADDVILLVEDGRPDGLVVGHVDLTSAAEWCKLGPIRPSSIEAEDLRDDSRIPFQFVPDADFDPRTRVAGTVVLRLPEGSRERLRLRLKPSASDDSPAKTWDGTVATPSFSITHTGEKLGGLPSRIEFASSGKVFDTLRWHDRTYHRELGGFNVINDPEPTVELVADGPLCTVVAVDARYMRVDGTRPESKPAATYRWFYFKDRPLVFVTVSQRQQERFAWHEWHFLELIHPGEAFGHFAGGEPLGEGQFTGSKETPRFSTWAAFVDGNDSIAMLKAGQMAIHDGKGSYGAYLHAFAGVAWTPFSDTSRRMSAWLRIASDRDPAGAIRAAAEKLPSDAHVTVSVDTVRASIESARRKLADGVSTEARDAWWHAGAAEQLEAQGRFAEAIDATAGKPPEAWTILRAGDLGMIVERVDDGIRLLQLCDVSTGQELLAAEALPLFTLTLRNAESKREVQLDADVGWKGVAVERVEGRPGYELRWERPTDEQLGAVSVNARVEPDGDAAAFRWTLAAQSGSDRWSIWRVVFPRVGVADLGSEGAVLFPRGAGEVQTDPWRRAFSYHGTYPSGWTTMAFMAAYSGDGSTGLYVGVHDPLGSTKDINVTSRPERRSVVLSIDHPVADMGRPGNRFELGGEAVWRLLRGDWFDASVIYRDWVREEAEWFPDLTAEGREDTPPWMRELSCWALSHGKPESCVPEVKRFAEFLGVPIGVHWYNWHQIPFDNDYPHYFPTHEGFAAGVRELRAADVYVMPYINGRLWDTRDKGAEDFQFSKIGLPGATKAEDGEPHTEMYGSKESDGSRVKLAAMCPVTEVWQDKVREIVLRLFDECGVSGVYIDQVAAAKPRLCFDASHGHPLGGGHWWTRDGYWPLMDRIHQAMPDDRMLTTECNAEPYIRWFDGYLTWHWQYDGQVPAFAAVYGGAIQMFGRAYRGGPTKDLALRMKAGQQLVFGEQIGWIHPGVVNEKENAAFLCQIVQLRYHFRRYFHAGEMARPPKLIGEIPTVTADWQWSGEWPVTTEAVMTGAWSLPKEKRAVLMFVNVGDEPVTARLEFDGGKYGMADGEIRVRKVTAEASEEGFVASSSFERELSFAPREAWAWEVTGR